MSYKEAQKKYAKIGIDTEKAIKDLGKIAISLHCWQGDDVGGFETTGGASGGIATTGNYPGKARTPEELMKDLEFALALIPGKHRVNLHACYGIHKGHIDDRDKLTAKNFEPWVKWAKKTGVKLDFNPTFFSHKNVKDGLTLSSPDKKIRSFWIKHGIQCLKIRSPSTSRRSSRARAASTSGCPTATRTNLPTASGRASAWPTP